MAKVLTAPVIDVEPANEAIPKLDWPPQHQFLNASLQQFHGLAEIRNLYGHIHGRGEDYRGLEARHAQLAVFKQPRSVPS